MLGMAKLQGLTMILLFTVVFVSSGNCFQEPVAESSAQAKHCSRFYLFEFGGYHYYSTVLCSTTLPCRESSSEIINVHKEKLKTVGCLPNNLACGCQAPTPDGQVGLVRDQLQAPAGDTILNWEPTDAENNPKNPQGDKWVAFDYRSQPKYAVTKTNDAGTLTETYFYLVDFSPVVFDYNPKTGIQRGTKRAISGPKHLAIRLSSKPPRGKTIFPAEVVDQAGAVRLRVAQHDQLFDVVQ
jgi:hypothetical protein